MIPFAKLMTQEEKAKAYDEALEDMRVIYPNLKGDAKLAVEHAFPQLRESEVERVIKWIAKYIHSGVFNEEEHPIALKAIEWLEKQKEQKPPVDVDPCDASWDAYYQRGLNKGYELGLEAGMKEQKPFSQEDFDSAKHEALWEEQKHELVQHPPITYTYPSDASRDEQLKLALIALLNNDLIQVRGSKFTKQDLIDWVEQKPAWSEEDERILKGIIGKIDHDQTYGVAKADMLSFLKRYLEAKK